MKVLLLTVGGSDKPIVESIKRNQPDYVVFFCTEARGPEKGSRITVDGDGLVCQDRDGEARPCIVAQTGLSRDQYEIVIVEADDLYSIYKTSYETIISFLKQGNEVIVDYTGGTKSMSAGLAAAGMDHEECKFSLVKGPRLDLIKVRDGMERVSQLPNRSFVFRQKELCQRLIEQWDYSGAARILEQIDRSGYLMPEDEDEISRLLYLSRGFELWDRFEYREAVKLIELYKTDGVIKPYNTILKQLVWTLDAYSKWTPDAPGKHPGFLLVYDVLLNAERKAAGGYYDDAVARIYRAVEMYAQFCLRYGDPPLTSDDIDLERLPEPVRDEYKARFNTDSKISIGLTENYNLLTKLGNPIGPVWMKWKSKIVDVLQKRNYSFLAHGFNPLTEQEYLEVRNRVWAFITECDSILGNQPNLGKAVQLPKRL